MSNEDLFSSTSNSSEMPTDQALEGVPLAERMRPSSLDDFVGQEHLIGPNSFLRKAIENDSIPSMILWGPPGSGKTSLAKVIARTSKAQFVEFSAVLAGVKEVREVISKATFLRKTQKRKTILFVDEIHRFNRAQQDAFLPHVEASTITLIGATTENPFFEVTSPLLSRCRVVRLKPLSIENLMAIGKKAMHDTERGLGGSGVAVSEEVMNLLARRADGDARRLLNILEACVNMAKQEGKESLDNDIIQAVTSTPSLRYDRAYEEHYNLASAFIKSMRGSDPDAALYYMTRMLEGGEDPAFIIRRMIIFAAEDIGNADPQALLIAVATKEAYEFLGMPEAKIPMAQAVTYLSCAPKSNASYRALHKAEEAVKETGTLEVPLHILNAPVSGMAKLGYGQGYAYPHDYEGGYVPVHYLPEKLAGTIFYEPSNAGFERTIAKRLEAWRSLRGKKE
jgi:putative ATPase